MVATVGIILLCYLVLKFGFIAINESNLKFQVSKLAQRASFCFGTAIIATLF